MKSGNNTTRGAQVSPSELQSKEALYALYHETWEEITRLRQFEWRIGYYFLTISIGLIALLLDASFQLLLDHYLRFVITVVQIISGLFAVYYLIVTHGYLTEQRNIRRNIERVCGFYDKNIYRPESVLPETWNDPVTKAFQFRNLVVPIASVVILVQLFSIYILWNIDGSRLTLPSVERPSAIENVQESGSGGVTPKE
ncbi:MAG: hypothetical protein L0287_35860 [Anaerolineae bacterium]|nr:hypothetical protein [Anaerolineae bacterium]